MGRTPGQPERSERQRVGPGRGTAPVAPVAAPRAARFDWWRFVILTAMAVLAAIGYLLAKVMG